MDFNYMTGCYCPLVCTYQWSEITDLEMRERKNASGKET